MGDASKEESDENKIKLNPMQEKGQNRKIVIKKSWQTTRKILR